MPLTPEDRKTISKRYIDIPEENISYANNIVILDVTISELKIKDASFKNLFDEYNTLIEPYHNELEYLVGELRTSISEQDIQNSATKAAGNFFFPIDFDVNPPGIWKELKTYAKNKVIGKEYSEVYTTGDGEIIKIAAVSTLTASIAIDYTEGDRESPVSVPPALEQDKDDLIAAVTTWKNWLNSQKTALQENLDPDQVVEIEAAISDIDLSLAEIDTWENLDDFAVDGKVSDSGLQILDDEILRRTPKITSRFNEINTRLGNIVQNPDGSIASQSGLYSSRYINLDARINLAEGALTKQYSIELAKRVQNENIINNNTYLNYLNNEVLIATKMLIDGNNTNTITVDNPTNFNISDIIFLISESETEIIGTITNKIGNIITLNFVVSPNFKVEDFARLVKEI